MIFLKLQVPLHDNFRSGKSGVMPLAWIQAGIAVDPERYGRLAHLPSNPPQGGHAKRASGKLIEVIASKHGLTYPNSVAFGGR